MRILHYSLGFPPQRRGGLVNYCLDLAREQVQGGAQVAILYPGRARFLSKETSILKQQSGNAAGVLGYEVLNPLPLSLMGGFRKPADFMKPVADSRVYETFLADFKPDVIHLHTFYGLHQEFLEVARNKGIPLIYTTHDYYGLCANPTFFYQEEDYAQKNSVALWYGISAQAMAPWQLRLLQAPIYPAVRSLSKKLRIARTRTYQRTFKEARQPPDATKLVQLQRLRDYYQAMFRNIDSFHFNSSVAEKVYRKNIKGPITGRRIPLINQRVTTQRPVHKSPSTTRRIAYAGPYEGYKGYEVFLQWAAVHQRRPGVSFHLWGDSKAVRLPDYIKNHGRFRQATEMHAQTDVLIVPSLWQETFGLHVVEALAAGTPVFASHNVGAGELLPEEYVFENLSELALERVAQARPITTDLVDRQSHVAEIAALYHSL